MDAYTASLLSARPANPFDRGRPQAEPTYELLSASLGNPFERNQPKTEPEQESPASEFIDPVYPRGWELSEPPVAIRIPAEYNPNDPTHVSAVRDAYTSAYEGLPQATLEYLTQSGSQQARVEAQKKAASTARGQLAAAEEALKYKLIPAGQGGLIRLENPQWTAKEAAERQVEIDKAKKTLKAAEAGLAEASKPMQPRMFEVQLPKAAPPQQEQTQAATPAQPQAQAPEEGDDETPQESTQQRLYRMNMEMANRWAGRQIERGVKHEAVKARLSAFMDELKSKVKPEYRKLGDGLYYFKDPSSEGVKVSDTGKLREEIYKENLTAFSKQMQNLYEIDKMASLAEEAATLKVGDPRRAEIITALTSATKAINTAIAGTSDAVSQQEYNRVAGALGVGIINNWTQAFSQDSITKAFTTNPKGFASSLREIRDIASNRTKGNYNTVRALERRVGVPMQDVPDWYKSAIKRDISEVIRKDKPAAQPQAAPVTSKSGVQFTVKRPN